MKLSLTKKPLSSSQRTLDKFFTMSSPSASSSSQKTPPVNSGKRSPSKRKNDDEECENLNTPKTPKRTKTGGNEKDSGEASSPSMVLTPEQKSAMNEKQIAARLKRAASTYPLIDPASIGSDWFREILELEFRKPYFKQLSDFYCSLRTTTIYPKQENIFSWTRYCKLRDVKVVIIGQDPYHGPNQAHGLCFSVQKGVPSPPSLLNMYKELVSDPGVPDFDVVPSHGCLEGWARQGVLLLNAVLTVEQAKANSHKEKGWENLTTAVIKWISSNLRDVVFLLWGAHAQKMGSVVDKKRHSVLTTVHPSPLSAHRGFMGCRHFSKCNELLVAKGKEEIRWEELP